MQRWEQTIQQVKQHDAEIARFGVAAASRLAAQRGRAGMPHPMPLSYQLRGGSVHDAGLVYPQGVPYL